MEREAPQPYVATWGTDDTAHRPFAVSNPLLADPAALRHRFQQDGYVFFRGLLDAGPLRALRTDILTVCARHGWLQPGHDASEGRAHSVPRVEGQEEYAALNDDIQRLERFHGFAHQPALLNVMRHLLGAPLLVHPLSVSRLMFPSNAPHTTPPHQDYPNNQGSPETYAAWIPLGDCPRTLGSLSVLQGSHRFGALPMRHAMGAGYRTVRQTAELEALPWISDDMGQGDVLIFHSLTVHRALPNRSADHMRVSVDYRYQNARHPVTENSLQPHFGRLTWDQIYAGWQSREHQYYWRALDLTVVPYEPPGLPVSPADALPETAPRFVDRLRRGLVDRLARLRPRDAR